MNKKFAKPTTVEEAFQEAKLYYKNARESLKKSPIEYGISISLDTIAEG